MKLTFLLAVLSSDKLPASSSTSESLSLSVSDYAISDEFKLPFSESNRNLLNDIILDNDGIVSSNDNMFSPLSSTDTMFSSLGFADNLIDLPGFFA